MRLSNFHRFKSTIKIFPLFIFYYFKMQLDQTHLKSDGPWKSEILVHIPRMWERAAVNLAARNRVAGLCDIMWILYLDLSEETCWFFSTIWQEWRGIFIAARRRENEIRRRERACWFEPRVRIIADRIFETQMRSGGWICNACIPATIWAHLKYWAVSIARDKAYFSIGQKQMIDTASGRYQIGVPWSL